MLALRDRIFESINRRVFYGWAMVAVAMLTMFASGAGQSHTFSVFLGPVSRDLGLSQTEWGAAYGVATLFAALGLPYMGRFTDRLGPRKMLLLVATLLGAACLAFGATLGAMSLGLGFAALRFLGQGSLMLNASNLVSRWFSRRRGFALSLMALGFSASMAVHPPLAHWLIEQVGWRQAWVWIGFSTWVLLIPCVYLLVRDTPSSVGLAPDGVRETSLAPTGAAQTTLAPTGAAETSHAPTGAAETSLAPTGAAETSLAPEGAAGPSSAQASRAQPTLELTGMTRAQAVRTPAFYIICVGLFTLSMLVTALHLFQVSIFAAHGVDAQIAASVFPVSAFTMVIAMPLIGRVLDTFPTRWVFLAGQLVMVCSLLSVSQVTGLYSAIAYAVVFGLNNSVTMTLFAFIWPRYFGLRHLGSIQGMGQMVGVVGASLGALPLGIAFDRLGSYDTVLVVLALQPALCAVLALFLRPPAILELQRTS